MSTCASPVRSPSRRAIATASRRERVAPLALRGVDELDRELAEEARPEQAIGVAERDGRLLVERDQASRRRGWRSP